jgi:putative ABC transport system permease protein
VVKVPVRNLFRNRRRTASTTLGIAAGVSLVLVSAMLLDAIDDALFAYFGKVQRYDALVMFVPAQSEDVAFHLARRPEVRRAEPGLTLPVELEKNGRRFSTMLLGLPRAGQLYRVLDARGAPTHLTDRSLRVGNMLRRRLRLETGDVVRVRYAFSSKEVPAEGILHVGPPIQQPATAMVYADLDVVRGLFGAALDLPPRPVTGVSLAVAPGRMAELKEYLHRLPHAAAVEITADTQTEVDRKMRFTYAFVWLMLLFGGGLALAIVFNTLSINVLERTREIATLRTLGFQHRQIALMTSIENLLTALLGLIPGLPLGYLLAVWLLQTYQSETVSPRILISARTYGLVTAGMLLLVLLAQIPSLQSLRRVDLAKATKERNG